MLEADVHSHAMKPGGELRPRLEAPYTPISFTEGLNCRILGRLPVSRHPIRQSVDARSVAEDQRIEGAGVALLGKTDQCRVAIECQQAHGTGALNKSLGPSSACDSAWGYHGLARS